MGMLTESINPVVVIERAACGKAFAQARPFRHLVLDDFLTLPLVTALQQEFPAFERGNALDEAGNPGAKSVVEEIATLGPAYARLDGLIRTREFLDLIGTLTGIEDLRFDPHYFGGGTHENRAGQELDPHVDFNVHPVTGWHRRLNLIIYLNPRWERAWGGSLELHSDPRSADDEITLIDPIANRCVIFETTERSWHGFSRIGFPPGQTPLGRRSIALYFYTTTRPPQERADPHSTIYVDRPLPAQIRAGHTLEAHDQLALEVLIHRRDAHIRRLYRDITALTRELDTARGRLRMSTLGRLAHYARRFLALIGRDR